MLDFLDQDQVVALLGDVASNKIAQSGFFFTLAAWLHAGRVKKEIASQFQLVTTSINSVAQTLGASLNVQQEITSTLVKDVSELKTDVSEIKSKLKEK